jgi:hypothetical protein
MASFKPTSEDHRDNHIYGVDSVTMKKTNNSKKVGFRPQIYHTKMFLFAHKLDAKFLGKT